MLPPPADPPPPYQINDPASSVDAPSISTQVEVFENTTVAGSLQTFSLLNQCGPLHIRLPNAPPPPSLPTVCSMLPLIQGHAFGSQSQCPKPGRRKPRAQQKQQLKKQSSVPLSSDKRYKRQAH